MTAAVELGVFERLRDGPRDLTTLARETGCAERGLENLLRVLVPLGYVEHDDRGYRLTSVAARTLPEDLADMLPFFEAQAEMHLEAAPGVREAPEAGIFGWEGVRSGEVGRGYQAAMRWPEIRRRA